MLKNVSFGKIEYRAMPAGVVVQLSLLCWCVTHPVTDDQDTFLLQSRVELRPQQAAL